MKQELALSKWDGWNGEAGKLVAGGRAAYDFPYTADVREFDCIEIEADGLCTQALWLDIVLFPLASGRPELIRETKASVCVPPGCRYVCVPYSAFAHSELVCACLKYISSMEIAVRTLEETGMERAVFGIRRIAFALAGDFQVRLTQASLVGDGQERLEWEVWLENEADISRYITVTEKRSGREMISLIYPAQVVLKPREIRRVSLYAQLTEQIPAGGYEARVLEWIPDGDGSRRRTVTLYAARKMVHPFLLHTDEGWERLRRQLEMDRVLQERFQMEYEQAAKDWAVPEPHDGKEWVYESAGQDDFLKTVIAWKVTGKQEYLEKVLRYFQGLFEEERGYLATQYSYFQCVESQEEYGKGTFPVRHAVSAGWVQEGEFMTKLAIAYDLLADRREFTEEMHQKMERCMRNYMEFVSWRLTDGDGNNFQLSESSAALYFACLLQDYPMIERFLSGTNGLYELLGSVLSDDGSYFEGASNYIRLAAEILLHAAIACENFGLNLKDMTVPASHDTFVIHAPWAVRTEAGGEKPFLGMDFKRALPTKRSVRRLKDFTDNVLRLLTPQGILFSANDSNEKDMISIMEMAYYLYRDKNYLSIAQLHGHGDLLYGKHMLAEEAYVPGVKSCLNTGNGFAVLRENQNGCSQVVMKYGQHGGYHGHYDRLSLVSFIRENQTFHNMEFSWYSYGSFLFKMWVQTSLAHNMVVVDRKMQEPSFCECIYFKEEENFQAVCAQTVSRWSDPPYGGQTPYLQKFPEEKCAREGRYILTPEQGRRQGDIGEYSEPVFQRRLMVLAEGCCFVWDYEEAEHSHIFECFYHPFGRMEMEAEEIRSDSFSEYLDRNPYGAAQFIRSCHWYHTHGTVKISFLNQQKRVNPNDIIDFVDGGRLYGVYPQEGDLMIGRYPHRQDCFAEGENCGIEALLEEPCKKAVAFHQEGNMAQFVTALEIGTPQIRGISCRDYGRIQIERMDGSRRELIVEGMDCKDTREISVTYRKIE